MSEDLKFCRDCDHLRTSFLTGKSYCHAPEALSPPNLVTGWRASGDCATLRGEGCGREAKWFKARAVEEEPQVWARINTKVEVEPVPAKGFLARLWDRLLDK